MAFFASDLLPVVPDEGRNQCGEFFPELIRPDHMCRPQIPGHVGELP
jgi:hypothetical protein